MRSNKLPLHTWRRRLLAVAATVMLVLGTAMPTTAMAGVINEAPDHAMTPEGALKDNGDGTYDVTLSVTGDTEETVTPKAIDVIYLVDRSLSMMGSERKTACNAITAAANKYLTAENAALPKDQQVQMAVIAYGRKAEVKQGFTNNVSDITNALPSIAYEAGTNWEDALAAANSLTTGRAGAEKRIILISDSAPTLRTSAEGYKGPPHHDGTYGWSVGDPKERNYSAAKRAALARGDARLYVTPLSSKATEVMNRFANETDATYADGTSQDKLTAALTEMNTIIKKEAGYKDVKLVGQLSDAAEFVTAADGSLDKVRYAKDGTDWADAPAATVEGSKLTWDLSGIDTLKDGVIYSVTFTIRPSAQALTEVAKAGQAKTFDASVASESHVEYKTITTTDGVGEASDPQTSVFGTVSPTFEVAAPKPATVSLTATKVLKGAKLADGQFTFELSNNGDVMGRTTNDADGKISFRELTLKQSGTYTFTMREVAGNAEGMTYDNTEHVVKVTVTDNGQGQLVAAVEGDNPTFTNTVASAGKPTSSDKQMPQTVASNGKPTSSDKHMPLTGDANSVMLPIMLVVAAAVCIAGAVALARKK